MTLGESLDAFEHATALCAFGCFLRRRGERRSAVDYLERARRSAAALRAAPLLGRCDAELAACGRATPLPTGRPIDPLTPQERAVARLACAGRSTKEIAVELVLSSKTVGYHLGHM